MMWISEIAVLVVGCFNFFLGILVLQRNPKSLLHRIFFLLQMIFTLWGFSLFSYQYPQVFSSNVWIHIAYLMVFCMVTVILIFSYLFPIPVPKKTFIIGSVINVSYLLFSVWLLLFTPWLIVKVAEVPGKGMQTIIGAGYLWWSVYTWAILAIAAVNLIQKNARVDKLQRLQLTYFWVAFSIFGLLVSVPDVFIPLLFKETRYFYVSSVSSAIFSGIVAYIILRHRFLDVRRLVIRIASSLVVTFALGIVYVIIAFVVGTYFFPRDVNIFYILVTVTLALVFRMVIHGREVDITRRLQKRLSKDTYEREEVIEHVSQILVHSVELPQLVRSLAEYLSDVFKTYNASLVIINRQKNPLLTIYSLEKTRRFTPESQQFRNEILQTIKKLVVVEEMPKSSLVRKLLQSRNVAISSPLIVRGELIGYLTLYAKKYDRVFSDYDIKTIELISPHVAIAAQNALHLNEIKHFNSALKKEVGNATAELRNANKELQELDRLKDEFISMASHELRTPTTVIKSFLWILLHKNKDILGDTRKRIERIYQLANHMGNLIKDMLDVSMIESGKMHLSLEQFDISQLIKESIEEIRMVTSAKREIHFSQAGSFMVLADRDKTHQVLGNLLTNAIKYTKENGKITITVAEKDRRIAISVSDNGLGIKKTDMNKLFTKFGKLHSIHSSEGQIPGSGLGLFITKRIIELSSGNLFVESTFGKGSTFTFTLPKSSKR